MDTDSTIDSNQDMSNCPSLPEILYSISHNNLFNNIVNKNIFLLIISTIFIVFVTIISYLKCVSIYKCASR